MELSKEQQDIKYKWYSEAFSEAKGWAEKLSQSEDRLILTISSGALVLSITFINTIITSHGIQYIKYLKWSWIFLVITIIVNLLSIWSALKSTDTYIDRLNKWLPTNEMPAPNGRSFYFSLTRCLSNLSYITLVIGIISMTYFAWLNINSLILLK
jgi:hypothetical protein